MDVYLFSAALPEKFNDAIRLDAFETTGDHSEYDEVRAGTYANPMPYRHAYCGDAVATDSLVFTVTVDQAGVYEVAVHIRLKDQKERGATFVINEGTEYEQSIKATYGWATADEAILVRDNDFLQSAYYTGLKFNLQAGENTITIKVADNASKKSQHFRDLYLVWSADLPAEEPEGPQTLTAEEAIALGITYAKNAYSEEFYYVTLTLNTQVNPNGFARATLEGKDMIISVAAPAGYVEGTYKVGDTVTFLAQVGCVNSNGTSTTKEARLFNATVVEVVPAV